MPKAKAKTRRPPPPDAGFVCPRDGAALHVQFTRRSAKGVIYRIRECPLCGFLEITEERKRRTT